MCPRTRRCGPAFGFVGWVGGGGLFNEAIDFAVARYIDAAEAGDLFGGDGQGGEGDIGAGRNFGRFEYHFCQRG